MGKKSFLMMLLAAVMLSSVAQAEMKSPEKAKELKAKKKSMSIDEIKAKAIKRLDMRIAPLQAAKECMQKATTKKQIKECRPKYKHKKKMKSKK